MRIVHRSGQFAVSTSACTVPCGRWPRHIQPPSTIGKPLLVAVDGRVTSTPEAQCKSRSIVYRADPPFRHKFIEAQAQQSLCQVFRSETMRPNKNTVLTTKTRAGEWPCKVFSAAVRETPWCSQLQDLHPATWPGANFTLADQISGPPAEA